MAGNFLDFFFALYLMVKDNKIYLVSGQGKCIVSPLIFNITACAKMGEKEKNSWSGSPPNFFFFKTVLAVWDSLKFLMNFRMDFSILAKYIIGILVRIALNLQMVVGGTNILKTLNFLTHEHRLSFHLFISLI